MAHSRILRFHAFCISLAIQSRNPGERQVVAGSASSSAIPELRPLSGVQRKTQRPVQFELTEPTRATVATWIEKAKLKPEDLLFPSRLHHSPHVSTRQYARIVEHWVTAAGLDPSAYGTHSMRRKKAMLIYKRTKNLPAVQLLLGHSKLESTVRYLGIEVDDALEISEQIEI
ncbi:MAG TPA: tyrosine-type recombinase/integrase [Rhodocyclaceae bacterium]|nr:tyrosine-type recombinase/integrase [Rhodocyclaceae bacterium]